MRKWWNLWRGMWIKWQNRPIFSKTSKLTRSRSKLSKCARVRPKSPCRSKTWIKCLHLIDKCKPNSMRYSCLDLIKRECLRFKKINKRNSKRSRRSIWSLLTLMISLISPKIKVWSHRLSSNSVAATNSKSSFRNRASLIFIWWAPKIWARLSKRTLICLSSSLVNFWCKDILMMDKSSTSRTTTSVVYSNLRTIKLFVR